MRIDWRKVGERHRAFKLERCRRSGAFDPARQKSSLKRQVGKGDFLTRKTAFKAEHDATASDLVDRVRPGGNVVQHQRAVHWASQHVEIKGLGGEGKGCLSERQVSLRKARNICAHIERGVIKRSLDLDTGTRCAKPQVGAVGLFYCQLGSLFS